MVQILFPWMVNEHFHIFPIQFSLMTKPPFPMNDRRANSHDGNSEITMVQNLFPFIAISIFSYYPIQFSLMAILPFPMNDRLIPFMGKVQ